jgi:beta-lactamase class D
MLAWPKQLGRAALLLTCLLLALAGERARVRADDIAPQLTAAAVESLGNRQGSVIVLDPHSGRILVLVHEDIALQNAYLPGSLFKIVTAAAALEEGLVDEHTTIDCQGQSVFYGRPLYCWYRPGHGPVNIRKALALSCNVYFYHLGQRVGAHNLLTYAARFKLGETTGINKPGEVPGSLPTWISEQDVPVLAVGQSKALAVTPIQVAGLIAAIANGGFFYQPYIPAPGSTADDTQPVLRGRVELSRALEIIREGLRESADYGTSIASSAGLEAVAGKTGTASQQQGGKTDAWFAGYFPADRPEIALVVFIRSGIGAADAAPVAAQVLKSYLRLRHATLLPPAIPARQNTVRVSILTKHHPATLRLTPSGGGVTLYTAAGGEPWGELRDGAAIRITRQGAELAISGAGAQAVLLAQLRLSPLQQHVRLKAELPGGLVRSYNGELTLRAGTGELEIINLVQEDDYLASVVQSEMGHAPLQALKAQALVSRTFLAKTLAQSTGPYDVTDFTDFTVTSDNALPAERGEQLLEVLEEAFHRLEHALQYTPERPIHVRVHASTARFTRATGKPWWVAAVALQDSIETQPIETLGQRGILHSTLVHELAHVFINGLANYRCPLWLNEALAVHLSGEGQ